MNSNELIPDEPRVPEVHVRDLDDARAQNEPYQMVVYYRGVRFPVPLHFTDCFKAVMDDFVASPWWQQTKANADRHAERRAAYQAEQLP